MAAAVVELDALPDAVGSSTEDHHPFLARLLGPDLVLIFPGGIVVGRLGLELGGAGVDRLVGGQDPAPLAIVADLHFRGAEHHGQLPVGEARLLGVPHQAIVDRRERADGANQALDLHDLLQLVEEPAIDGRELVDFLDRHARLERIAEIPDAVGVGSRHASANVIERRLSRGAPEVLAVAAEAEAADLQAAERLLEGLLERAADRHRLPDALHLRGEPAVGLGEFLEREPRHLHDDVVDRGLEAGLRPPRDVVGELVEPPAHRQLRGDLRDWKAGGLARQRA